MDLPDYQTFMLPLLKALLDGEIHRFRDLTHHLADEFQLSNTQREALLPSGQQTILANRIGWAKTYLKKAGLLEYPIRGSMRITQAGRNFLSSSPTIIDSATLQQFPGFLEFKESKSTTESPEESKNETEVIDSRQTPDELMDEAFQTLRRQLSENLLERLSTCSPSFFERVVVDLLVAMGYGGSIEDAGRRVGRSGDNGIDGIINEDRLGLDIVCLQAKRWQQKVGRPEVQAFAGSMEGFRARKGVLITTSDFTIEAIEYVQRIERKIVLINGTQLAQHMIDFGIGVSATRSYIIKRIDSDYFDSEEVD